MDTLDQKCLPCKQGTKILSIEECYDLVKKIPQWDIESDKGILKLQRIIVLSNFMSVFSLAEKIALLSEENGHHPALLIEWGKITISWWTHKIDGLHNNDFIMASKVDELLLLQKTESGKK